jgi:hypothetical protein
LYNDTREESFTTFGYTHQGAEEAPGGEGRKRKANETRAEKTANSPAEVTQRNPRAEGDVKQSII